MDVLDKYIYIKKVNTALELCSVILELADLLEITDCK